jgi:hypothetical protein
MILHTSCNQSNVARIKPEISPYRDTKITSSLVGQTNTAPADNHETTRPAYNAKEKPTIPTMQQGIENKNNITSKR